VRVELPYGTRPYPIDIPSGRAATVLRPSAPESPPPPLRVLLDDALAPEPAWSLPAGAGARVTLIISDATRAEPRAAFIEAVRARLPPATRLTIAIATGTHGPAKLDQLDIPAVLLAGAAIVNHDGHSERDLVTLGTTPRGTPVRVHGCVVDADLIIATGCIRPHYFAGFGAGVKAVFPGLGEAAAIRINHRLKLEPGARAGILVGNPCREDIEDAVRVVAERTPIYLLNGVCDPDDRIRAVVAGDVVDAFRAGCELARPWFSVDDATTAAPLVIASDALPITARSPSSQSAPTASAPSTSSMKRSSGSASCHASRRAYGSFSSAPLAKPRRGEPSWPMLRRSTRSSPRPRAGSS
jgi:hypothetical protein